MISRELGRTGMRVSLLSLGTVKIGRQTGLKYPAPFTIPDDTAVLALLETAHDLGITLLDTAPAYGDSEARLGRLLKVCRGHFRIATKVGEEFTNGRSIHDFSAAHTRMSVERSLHRLQRDHLDIVLIHSDGRDEEILDRGEVVSALRDLKAAGLIGAIGLSAKSSSGIDAATAHGLDVVMATASPVYRDELPAIAAAHRAGLGVLVKKAMQSGHSAPESLQFVALQEGVTSIVTGTVNLEHLIGNARLLDAIEA